MRYKWWLFLAIFLFGGGLIFGLATSASTIGLLAEDLTALKELAEFLAPLPQPSILAIIYIKNVSALLVSFLFSPLFWVVPVTALTLNGWLLGVVSVAVIQEKSLGYLLIGLLPHGVFEIPALFIGEAAALSFGAAVMRVLFRGERRSLLLPNLRQNLKYLTIALILLLPAAIIETYITPLLLR
ncbi:MAG: stage II sporulation protein M [Chloroflexi bacterium]|nr:stage II sporulation protein M [Chloroflexota bacterium]